MEKNFEEKIALAFHSVFVKNKYQTVIIFLSVFLGVFIINKMFFSHQSEEAVLYAKTKQAYVDWQNNIDDEKKFSYFIELTHKNPKLKAKYEVDILQSHLFYNKNISQLDIQMKSDFQSSFSKTTLLINEKKYDEALCEAKKLDLALQEQNSDNESFLYPYNLLRICLIYKTLNDNKNELISWNQLDEYINKKEANLKPFLENFQKDNRVKLNDYIAYRKKILSS